MQPTITTNRNDELHKLLKEATGTEPSWTSDVRANPFGWLRLDRPDRLKDAARALAGKARLCTVTAYAEERDDEDKRRRIAYHFTAGDTVITVTIPLYDPETLEKLPVPSITPWFLNADWNEREFMEMFNIDIVGHPNPKRLFLDERLDAGIMTKLIPFSAMAHGAASTTLWERVLEAKGVPPEDRMPSLTVPAEPIKVEPKITPVSATEPKQEPVKGPVTLAQIAAPSDAVEHVKTSLAENTDVPQAVDPKANVSVVVEPKLSEGEKESATRIQTAPAFEQKLVDTSSDPLPVKGSTEQTPAKPVQNVSDLATSNPEESIKNQSDTTLAALDVIAPAKMPETGSQGTAEDSETVHAPTTPQPAQKQKKPSANSKSPAKNEKQQPKPKKKAAGKKK